eukprot:TRINITY_DN17760_c0_g1_i2.p1 TRINITY_DN17760_c0_g1~~TRINITY_DN17760_c0_g1_i2.p1  ORF type:complete len:162 (-),score=13.71 TRINITY_DN17760_c0_g1_i2:304-789(-)
MALSQVAFSRVLLLSQRIVPNDMLRWMANQASPPAPQQVRSSNVQADSEGSKTALTGGLLHFLPPTDGDKPDAGRGWAMKELANKNFQDLQRIWIVCVREQNYLRTMRHWKKLRGENAETRDRMKKVRQSMARIKFVLSERAKEELDERKRKYELDKVNAS